MADFGGDFGGVGPVFQPALEDMAKQEHALLRKRRSSGGHRPPKGPRGPRFGLLRRIVRFIRGGGD